MQHPNEWQIGGDHYKTDFEHWDLVSEIGFGYLDGCASKYLCRWRVKGGAEDLRKAAHYLEKLKMVKSAGRPWMSQDHRVQFVRVMVSFCHVNEIPAHETAILTQLARWRNPEDLNEVIELVNALAESAGTTDVDEPGVSTKVDLTYKKPTTDARGYNPKEDDVCN